MFIAVKAETEEDAMELLTHDNSVLELRASIKKEDIIFFTRIQNAEPHGKTWIALRVNISSPKRISP